MGAFFDSISEVAYERGRNIAEALTIKLNNNDDNKCISICKDYFKLKNIDIDLHKSSLNLTNALINFKNLHLQPEIVEDDDLYDYLENECIRAIADNLPEGWTINWEGFLIKEGE